MNRSLWLAAILFWPLFAAAVRADDWPEFRGPTGQGLVQGALPVTWGPDRNVAWKQRVPGSGWSSPVVVAGRIYLTTAVPLDEVGKSKGGKSRGGAHSLEALCLDAKTGAKVWSRPLFTLKGARIHSKNSHASPTPLVAGGRLFVHFGAHGTACLDLDGKVLWKNDTIKYSPVHGSGGSPVLVDGKLVFSCDGGDKRFLVALAADSGKLTWKRERSGSASRKFSFSTPLVIAVAGKKQIISPGSDMVGAYDPADGREIWKVRYNGYSVIPRPVFGHGLVFLSSGYDRPVLLAIRANGTGDVTDTHVAWKLDRGAPHTPSPLLVGDELYLVSDSGVASCVDARTGTLHWRGRIGNDFSSSPLYADGKLYFQAEDGVGVVLRAGKKLERVARNEMKERTLASFAAADGALFIRTASHLYRIRP